MKYLLLFAAVTLIAVESCSPVRTRPALPRHIENNGNAAVEPEKKPAREKSAKKRSEPTSSFKDNPDDRFRDTSLIAVRAEIVPKGVNLDADFEDALVEFDKENYQSACEKFRILSETMAPGDSLRLEALFYNCECLIVKNILDQAEQKLNALLKEKELPPSIEEKVILRLGHIYCATDRKSEAENYFVRLKKIFPGSIYLPLANCESVNEQ